MKIYDLRDKNGQSYAFEVNNIGRRKVCRVISRILGCKIIREPGPILWSSDDDEFCEFQIDEVRFVVWEPWGDNSRYWIGPKMKDNVAPQWTSQLEKVKEAFLGIKTFLGIVLG